MRTLTLAVCAALALLGLEGLARLGVVPSTRARQDAAAAGADILIVGDSFALDGPGLAVGKLKADFERRGETVGSVAQPGAGPRQYRDTLRQQLEAHQPRLVVVSYYVGNDISDTMRDRRSASPARSDLRARLRRSYAVGAWLDGWGALRTAWRLRSLPASGQGLGALNPFLVELGRTSPDYLRWNLQMDGAEAEAAWLENRRLLSDIAAICRASDLPLRLHVWPSTLQVSSSHVAFYRSLGFQVDESWLGTDRPQALMDAFCREEGLTCRDFLPALRQTGRELYLDADDHWNPAGQERAFELMRSDLATAGGR